MEITLMISRLEEIVNVPLVLLNVSDVSNMLM